MNIIYKRWLLLNLNQLMRHTGVALTTWAGTGLVEQGRVNLHSLWIAFLAGAFFPTLAAFMSAGLPGLSDSSTTTTSTIALSSITTTDTPHEKPNP